VKQSANNASSENRRFEILCITFGERCYYNTACVRTPSGSDGIKVALTTHLDPVATGLSSDTSLPV
jgi:hypothetical protein